MSVYALAAACQELPLLSLGSVVPYALGVCTVAIVVLAIVIAAGRGDSPQSGPARRVAVVGVIRGRDIRVKVHPDYLNEAPALARTIAAARAERTIRARQAGEQRR